MTTVFDVTAGGVLNIEDAKVENLGGSDMNFAVHMNNWGEVTLNVENSEITAPYCAIRVFNSGYDMNNVTVYNSSIHADNRAIWVHNYIGDLDSSKHSDEAIAARLNFNIFNGTNTITAGADKAKENVVRYGFSYTLHFDANGNRVYLDDTWDGSVDTSWYEEGTDEFTLITAEQLAGLATLVNGGNDFAGKTVNLKANLDMIGYDWTPIGGSKAFAGTFDGNGKTVSNVKAVYSVANANIEGAGYGAGFFGRLGNGALVKDLTLDGVVINGRYNCTGALAGYSMGNVTLENVSVIGADITAFSKVGALVGLSGQAGEYTLTVKDCSVVDTTIRGAYNLGGVAGLLVAGNTAVITDTVVDVEFVLEDKYNGGNFISLIDNTNLWVYRTSSDMWYYVANADFYCYEATEEARAEYIDSLNLWFEADHLDALACNN